MAAYGSDCLFHFTGRDKTPEECCGILLSIIRNGLKFNCNDKESLEYIETLPEEFRIKFVTPIICLTEIPLGYIYPQMQNYGRFGIGLSKEWALKNHAQPVIYLDRTCLGFGEGLRILLKDIKDKTKVQNALGYIVPFFREFEFHEEREWRFIEALSGSEIKDRESNSRTHAGKYLNFERADIKYIIVPEQYLNNVRDKIEDIFFEKYGDRVISFEMVAYENISN